MTNEVRPTNWTPTPNEARQMAEELVKHAGLGIDDANKLLVGTGAPPLAAPGSRDAAILQRDRLKNDPEWAKRFLDGDTAARSEMTKLNALIVGEQP